MKSRLKTFFPFLFSKDPFEKNVKQLSKNLSRKQLGSLQISEDKISEANDFLDNYYTLPPPRI